MILVGNQRGGGKDLALHLMKQENEVVQLHSMRGFASDNLVSAFQETYAISRGTQCKKYLYSLSLNPPKGENASIEDFEAAIAKSLIGNSIYDILNAALEILKQQSPRNTDGISTFKTLFAAKFHYSF